MKIELTDNVLSEGDSPKMIWRLIIYLYSKQVIAFDYNCVESLISEAKYIFWFLSYAPKTITYELCYFDKYGTEFEATVK